MVLIGDLETWGVGLAPFTPRAIDRAHGIDQHSVVIEEQAQGLKNHLVGLGFLVANYHRAIDAPLG